MITNGDEVIVHTSFATDPAEALSEAGIEVACANGETVMVTELQAAGKKRMKASDYLLGHPIKVD